MKLTAPRVKRTYNLRKKAIDIVWLLSYKYKHINSVKPCQMVISAPKEGQKA